jgi:hypothetical protein
MEGVELEAFRQKLLFLPNVSSVTGAQSSNGGVTDVSSSSFLAAGVGAVAMLILVGITAGICVLHRRRGGGRVMTAASQPSTATAELHQLSTNPLYDVPELDPDQARQSDLWTQASTPRGSSDLTGRGMPSPADDEAMPSTIRLHNVYSVHEEGDQLEFAQSVL